jgi:hypothetical protein
MAEPESKFAWNRLVTYLIYIALFLIAAAIFYGIMKFIGII